MMMDGHIQVSDELAELGGSANCFFGPDSLSFAHSADRKKVGEEGREGGLAWACCGMRGWRESMEDASLMLPRGYLAGNWRDAALFGVFDGHGGEQVARFAVRQLPEVFAKEPEEDPQAAFVQAFLRIDELLRQAPAAAELRELTLPGNIVKESAENVGTTAVCCLVQGAQLVIANAGDSRAVLCQEGRAVPLSEDHKPDLPKERARIEAAGGFVQEGATASGSRLEHRVNGGLNLSRALGDLRYKTSKTLPPEAQLVSCLPDTFVHQWRAGVDEFVLLASDGVWECISNQQAVNFVRARLPAPGTKGLVAVLGELLEACCASHPTQRGGLGCDNMTAVLVRFEDPAMVVAASSQDGHQNQQEVVSEARSRQLEAALSQTIQKLAAAGRVKDTKEEREARLLRLKQELEEREAQEREEQQREEHRRQRRLARAQADSQRKKQKCCAAFDDEEEDADED
eukprot:TRINITY_DN34589_c0_g1_i1.p1 TRINITY_DN34589_c0_g1~~TRINITY_DN34589_c0_g1_i1.p1  ORF type:complete len:458 (-),score=111.80 TRINITY_DN34589_c0_g1_i1:412-1785(-)